MKKLLPFFLLIPVFSYSQKTELSEVAVHPIDARTATFSLPKKYAGTTPEQISEFLLKTIPNLQKEKSSVLFLNKTESKTGYHFLFAQRVDNISIYRGTLKVNVDKKGYVTSVFDNSYECNRLPAPLLFAKEEIEKIVKGYLDGTLKNATYQYEPVFFPDGDQFQSAYRIELIKEPSVYFEIVVDKNGVELYRNDLVAYNCPPPPTDSLVHGHVFLPDPLTTAGVSYGAPYADSSDTDVIVLNAQRVEVEFVANFDPSTDSFSLISPFCEMMDLDLPALDPAVSDTPFFSFTRSQAEFEDVNVFYHLNVFHQYINNLGFSLVNYPINVDAHALGGADNSMFVPGNPSRLLFGEGGVDDGEDADVILHEYGHAIMFSAAPGTNNGTERKSLDEANGDYFASSYSRSINSFQWQNVFSWDGHNPFWSGRSTVSSKHYPQNISTNYYAMTDIWSATMMQIWGDIGREETDELLLESAFGYSNNMTMRNAAALVMQADTALNGGANASVLLNRFVARGLLDTTTIGIHKLSDLNELIITNTSGFATGASPLFIQFNNVYPYAQIELFSSQGQLLRKENIIKPNSYQLTMPMLSPGVYILTVKIPQQTVTFKLIKL